MKSRAALQREYDVLDARIADIRRASDRTTSGNRSHMERRLRNLDERHTILHRQLYPVVINGQSQHPGPKPCRADGCPNDGSDFEQTGFCDLHFRIATDTASPQDREVLAAIMNEGRTV